MTPLQQELSRLKHGAMINGQLAESKIVPLISALEVSVKQLSKQIHHTECEDNFYSCPLHTDYCGPEEYDRCNCGAQENIEAIEKITKLIVGE